MAKPGHYTATRQDDETPQALSVDVEPDCTCPACRWFNRAVERLSEVGVDLDRIDSAALVIITADPDEPDSPSVRQVRLVSFEREDGLLAQTFERIAAGLADGEIGEAAPAPKLN